MGRSHQFYLYSQWQLVKCLKFTKEYAERLSRVQIESKDALEVVKQYDKAEAFFTLTRPILAYIKEHKAIKSHGGAGDKRRNYNKSNSPGAKLSN